MLLTTAVIFRILVSNYTSCKMNKQAKKLMYCAMQAAITEGYELQSVRSSEGDKEWLQSAVDEALGGYDTIIKHLKECVSLLSDALESSKANVKEIEEIFQEVADHCEDINVACDLHKIGGFPVILSYLRSPEYHFKICALDVLVAVAQNNEYCQNVLVDLNVIPELFQLIPLQQSPADQPEDTANLAQKSMHAVSCIVRNNKKGLNTFLKAGGLRLLQWSLQSTSNKLQLRTAFFLRSLCFDMLDFVNDADMTQFFDIFIDLLKKSDSLDLIECVLDTIVYLTPQDKQFLTKCTDKKLEISEIMDRLLGNPNVRNERLEITKSCEKLKNAL